MKIAAPETNQNYAAPPNDSPVGEADVLPPAEAAWQPLFDSLDLFSDDFMTERNQPSVAEKAKAARSACAVFRIMGQATCACHR